MAEARVSMSEISKSLFVDVRVTGVKTFHFRTWCAIQLIKLAAFVMPANVHVEVEQ